MTKEELFKKYSIDESHNVWDERIDNWMSVEIYRVMHGGNLPPQDDTSINWVTKFLDRFNHDPEFMNKMMLRKEGDWGSLYLTAKRMIYRHHQTILEAK